MKILKKVLFLNILSFPILLMGQVQDCSQNLKKAEKFYEEGNIENVEQTIASCFEKEGFTKSEKVEAYQLLVLVHLFEDDFSGAEQNMILLLKTNPDFVPKTNDPIELKELYSKFRTDPLYTLGIKLGLNSSYTTLLKYYSISNSTNTTNYENSLGFQVIGDFNLRLTKGIMWNLEPYYSNMGFVNNEFYNNDGSLSVTEKLDVVDVASDQKISYKETQSSFGLSTGIKLDLSNKKKITPYLITGVGYNKLLKINAEVERKYSDFSGSISADKKTLVISKKLERASSYFQINYGLGLKYKLGSGKLLVELRHMIGTNNITTNKYNSELLYKYYYLLDDIKMNSFMLSVGYLQSIYKPIILKRKIK